MCKQSRDFFVEQVKAGSQLEYGSDNRSLIAESLRRPTQRSFWRILPQINALPEPIKTVLALLPRTYRGLAEQDFLGKTLPTTVVSDDDACESIHRTMGPRAMINNDNDRSACLEAAGAWQYCQDRRPSP